MERKYPQMSNLDGVPPLSEDEERTYALMVEGGREFRAEHVRKLEENRKADDERMRERGFKPNVRGRAFNDSLERVPDDVRRWAVLRFSGVPFRKAGELSGSTWARVHEAKLRSEEFRCAVASVKDGSRELMLTKAMSMIEQSQDEGARISLPQAQLSMRIVSVLDREHFGDGGARVVSRDDDNGQRRLGGGGFVINVIGDAASAAARPVESRGKAIVYADV